MIRAATPLDAGRVGAILSGFVDATPWMPRIHSRAEDVAHAGEMIDRGWVDVICLPEVAGFIARDGETVHALYIAAAAQGEGHGKALLDHAKANTDRLSLWTFSTNDGARRFYEREGFAPVDRTQGAGNDEGLPDIRYFWERTCHERP